MSHDLSGLSQRFPSAFVTGGTGLIGGHVVRSLVAAGVEVTCLVMDSDPAPALRGLPVRIVRGDLSNPAAWEAHLKGQTIAFHLAAIYALWLPQPRKMFDVNVTGTRLFLQAARRAGIGRVVYTSSIAAIGTRPGRALSDETDPFNDWDVANDYVLSKYIAELEAFDCIADDFEVVAVNPAFPFGSGDRAPTPTGKNVLDIIQGRLPVVVEGGISAADVRDVAEGHLLGALRGKSGRRYILGGENITFVDFAERVAREAGCRPPLGTLPTKAFISFGRVAEGLATHVFRRPPIFTEKGVAYAAGRFLWYDLSRARDELGYQPRPLAEAIHESVAWFQAWKRGGGPPA